MQIPGRPEDEVRIDELLVGNCYDVPFRCSLVLRHPESNYGERSCMLRRGVIFAPLAVATPVLAQTASRPLTV